MRKVVKAVVYKHDKYLLQLRDDDPAISCPNTWGFFGGEVDNEESHEEALKRELQEELNWRPVNMELFCELRDFKNHCRTIYFSVHCNVTSKQLCLGEGQEMKWYYKEEVFQLNNLPNVMKKIIKEHETFLRNDKWYNNNQINPLERQE